MTRVAAALVLAMSLLGCSSKTDGPPAALKKLIEFKDACYACEDRECAERASAKGIAYFAKLTAEQRAQWHEAERSFRSCPGTFPVDSED